ncbi:MAG: hypothetical protein GC138_09825 [Gammaproteobacteria bacterium]|nr:hypothetical protein [Gammaproteobacteria bacterium]
MSVSKHRLSTLNRARRPLARQVKATITALVLGGLALAPIAAFAAEPANSPDVIASINGKALMKDGFLVFVSSRVPGDQAAHLNQHQLQELLHEYINRELIYQDAVAKGLNKAPQVTMAIANQSHNIVASFGVREILSKSPDEATLKEIYQRLYDKPTTEYKTRHIMVNDEATAKQLIDRLDHGEDFAKLARASSLDTSAKNGGELDWFSSQQMTKEFSDAVSGIKAGEYTHTPVQTRYGWHIVQLLKTRQIPAPSFEQVQGEIIAQWQKEAITNYINSLRKQAKIELK